MTPTFMGGEPIVTTTGKYAGNTIFQDEQNIGLRFMQSLPAELQAAATISTTKGRHNAKAEAFEDNLKLEYAGLRADAMSPEQQETLLALANQYISNMRQGHARVKLEDIRQHMNDTWFAWAGETTEDAVFYYRIHSPVVLIEFDHQAPVGAPSALPTGTTTARTCCGNIWKPILTKTGLSVAYFALMLHPIALTSWGSGVSPFSKAAMADST